MSKKEFYINLKIAFALPFIVLIVSPLTFYLGNRDIIEFSILDVLPQSILISILFSGLFFIILIFVRKQTNFNQIFSGLLLGLAFSAWVQSQLFVWKFGLFDGSGIHWEMWKYHTIFELVIWLIVIISTILIFINKKINLKGILSNSILILGLISIISSFFTAKNVMNEIQSTKSITKEYHSEELFTFRGNDTIIIILDSFQSDVLNNILRNDNTYDKSFLNGFTFYSNVISHYPNTTASIPSFLTGELYTNQMPISEFKNSVYDHSLYTIAQQHDIDVKAFINNEAKWAHDLNNVRLMNDIIEQNSNPNVKPWMEFLDYGLFRVSPTILKSKIYNNGDWFLQKIYREQYPPSYHGLDIRFLEIFLEKAKIKKDSQEFGDFYLFHYMLPHLPVRVDEHLRYNTTLNGMDGYKNQAKGALQILSQMFTKLKEIGVYDSSEILVISDHGSALGLLDSSNNSISEINSSQQSLALAIALYKPPFSDDNNPIKIDTTPLSVSQLSCLLNEIYHLDICYNEKNENIRKFYYYTFGKNESPDYLPEMTEFYLDGSSYNPANWRLGDYRYSAGKKIPIPERNFEYELGEKVNVEKQLDYIMGGWSFTESTSRWSDGYSSGLVFHFTKNIQEDLIIELELHPYLADGVKFQKVEVIANGKKINEWQVDEHAWYTSIIPENLIENNQLNILLQISNPMRPCEVSDSSDCRQIGISLHNIVINQYH